MCSFMQSGCIRQWSGASNKWLIISSEATISKDVFIVWKVVLLTANFFFFHGILKAHESLSVLCRVTFHHIDLEQLLVISSILWQGFYIIWQSNPAADYLIALGSRDSDSDCGDEWRQIGCKSFSALASLQLHPTSSNSIMHGLT